MPIGLLSDNYHNCCLIRCKNDKIYIVHGKQLYTRTNNPIDVREKANFAQEEGASDGGDLNLFRKSVFTVFLDYSDKLTLKI